MKTEEAANYGLFDEDREANDELPEPSSPFKARLIEIIRTPHDRVSHRSSLISPRLATKNTEEIQLHPVFQTFLKSHTLEKFDSLVHWIESSKKKSNPEEIYENVENFKFLSKDENESKFGVNFEVNFLAISPNNKLLAVGNEKLGVHLHDFTTMKKVLEYSDQEKFKDSCAVLGNNFLYTGGWNKMIKKWNNKTGKLLSFFEGHSAPILCLALAQNEKILISGGEENDVMIWDLGYETLKKLVNAHESPVSAALATADSSRIFTGSWDKSIKVWSYPSLLCEFILTGHKDMIASLGLSMDGLRLASGGLDATVKIWDLPTKRLIHDFEGHASCITGVRFSFDDGLVASSSTDKTIKIWNLVKSELKKSVDAHKEPITSMISTSDGHQLISASLDKNIRIAPLEKDYERHQFQGNEGEVLAIRLFHDNKRFASGGKDMILRVWNLHQATLIKALKGHEAAITALSVTSDDDWIVSGDEGGTIMVWDIESGVVQKTLNFHSKTVLFLKTINSSSMFSYGADNLINFFKMLNFSIFNTFDGISGVVSALDSNSDGSEFFFSLESGFEIKRLKTLNFQGNSLFGHKAKVVSVKVSNSDKFLLSGSKDGILIYWELCSNNALQIIESGLEIICVSMLNDDYTIISSHSDLTIRFFDLQSREQIRMVVPDQLQIHPVRCIELTDDNSTMIATGAKDNLMRKIIVNKVRTKETMSYHKKEVEVVTISRDQRYLAVGSRDKTISIWDPVKTKLIGVLEGHLKPVQCLGISSNSKEIYSGGEDNTLRRWDLENLKEIQISKHFTGNVNSLCLYECPTTEESRILACSNDKSLAIFDKDLTPINSHKFKEGAVVCVISKHNNRIVYVACKGSHITSLSLLEDSLIRLESFEAHQGDVLSLAISKNDELLVSSGSDMKIKIWSILEPDSTFLNYTIHTNQFPATKVLLDSKSTTLFTVCSKKIQVYNLATYKKVMEFESGRRAFSSICLNASETILYSGDHDNQVQSWNLVDLRELTFIAGHKAPITAMALSSDGQYLASGDEQGMIIVHDLSKRKEILTIESHSKVYGVFFINNKSKIISIHKSSTEPVNLWKCDEGKHLETISFKGSIPKSMLLSHNEKHLILGFNDSSIRVYDFESKRGDKSFQGHFGSVYSLLMKKDNKTLISAAADSNIIIWDFRSNFSIQTLKKHEEAVRALALNPEENLLFSGGEEKTVFVWDLKIFSLVRVIELAQGKIRKILFSAENEKILIACTEKQRIRSLTAFHSKTYQSLPLFEEASRGISSAVTSSDNKMLIAAGLDKTIRFYDLESGKTIHSFPGHSSELTALGISGTCQKVALADLDMIITIWDMQTNIILNRFDGHIDRINALIITTKGMVISGSSDRKVGLWSMDEDRLIKFLEGHTAEVLSIAINHDETKLLTAGNDVTVHQWDLKKMTNLYRFQSGLDRLNAISFFPNEKYFLAGGSQRHLKLWHLDQADSEPETIAILNSPIISISVSPNGLLLVIVLLSGKIQVWDAKNYTMMSEMEELAPNFLNKPIFLSNQYNRLMMFFDMLVDCFTGEVLFRFAHKEKMMAFFYDFGNRRFYFLSDEFKLFKLDNEFLLHYLFNYINSDSLLLVSRNSYSICDRPISEFPFIFSFLHLISIYERNELFSLEKLKEIYSPFTKNLFSKFYNVDLFSNTALDILIQRKNMNLIAKYFGMLFEYMDSNPCDFYKKVRFLIYNFRNGYNMSHLLCDLIPMMGNDLIIVCKLFDAALLPFDPAIYDNSMLTTELAEPLSVESDTIYIDKKFIEENIEKHLQNSRKIKKTAMSENCTILKAKLLCLPGLCDITLDQTFEFISAISDLESNNQIFSNTSLIILVNFIWRTQTYFLFKIEMAVFIVFFVLYNLNFTFLRNLRASDQSISMVATCCIIDIILFLYALFCMANELRQFFGSSNYFKSVWNYFDISLIPLLLCSSCFDFISILWNITDENKYIKLTYSVCAFCFWFRFLSYFRAFKETSSMIGLILNVISGVKHFMLFMILFIFTLTTSFYILQEDATGDFSDYWTTFLYFYDSSTADTSGITSTALVFDSLDLYFGIVSTFLFYIISLNLLVSIIGDQRSDCKSRENEIRVYELSNIIVDTHCSLLTNIVNVFRKPRKTGVYLVQLYNEKREAMVEDKLRDLQKQIGDIQEFVETTIDKKIALIKKENEKVFERIIKEIKDVGRGMSKDYNPMFTGFPSTGMSKD